MSKSVVRIMCWKRSHVTEFVMNRSQEQKLESDIPKMKKVCPDCKPENSAITIVSGATVFSPAKGYRCEHGHLSLISTLGEQLNVCFGPSNDEFVNVAGSLADLPNRVDEGHIACNHVVDGKMCDCKLTAIDDFVLNYPSSPGIKTRMRIGDVWDRHGIEPVRTGNYDGQGGYNESRSQKANNDRLARMSRARNTSKDRQPGKTINKATKTDYGHRNKSSVNPDRLK